MKCANKMRLEVQVAPPVAVEVLQTSAGAGVSTGSSLNLSGALSVPLAVPEPERAGWTRVMVAASGGPCH
jgi:hypothetical protein